MFSFFKKKSSNNSMPNNNNSGNGKSSNNTSPVSGTPKSSQSKLSPFRKHKTVVERRISISDGGAPRDAVSLGHTRSADSTRSSDTHVSRLFPQTHNIISGANIRRSTYTEKDVFPGGVKRGVKGIMMVGEGNDDVLSRARTYIDAAGELHFTDEDLDQYMQPSPLHQEHVTSSSLPNISQRPIHQHRQPELRVPTIFSMSRHGFEQDDEEEDMFWEELHPTKYSNGLSMWTPNSPELTADRVTDPHTEVTINDNEDNYIIEEDLTTSQMMAHIERQEPALSELEDADFPTEDISRLDTSLKFLPDELEGAAMGLRESILYHDQDDDTISQLSDQFATPRECSNQACISPTSSNDAAYEGVCQLPVLEVAKSASTKASYEAGILELEQLELEVLGKSRQSKSPSQPQPQTQRSESSTPVHSPLITEQRDIFALLSEMIASPLSNAMVDDSAERLRLARDSESPSSPIQKRIAV